MNQTLAAVTLWMIVAYLRRPGARRVGGADSGSRYDVCLRQLYLRFTDDAGMQNRTAAYLLGGGVTFAVLVAMIFKLKDNDAKGIS